MSNFLQRHTEKWNKPKSMNMKLNAYSGWLISYRGMIYSVMADTPRKALNKFKKQINYK